VARGSWKETKGTPACATGLGAPRAFEREQAEQRREQQSGGETGARRQLRLPRPLPREARLEAATEVGRRRDGVLRRL